MAMDRAEKNILAVWGSPSSGKTTVAAKIANYLSKSGYDTALLLCDMDAPPLPLMVPPTDIETEKSLGSIMAAAKINKNLILQNCVTIRKNRHISVIGMLKGENYYTYPPYTDSQVGELLSGLSNLVDFVIVDCSSHIVNDPLSTISLIESDAVLRLISCDLKSISYLSSQLPLLEDGKFNVDKQIKVANNVKSIHSGENIEQILGNVDFTIPHCDSIEEQYLTGELLKDIPSKRDTRDFKKVIENITSEVFGV